MAKDSEPFFSLIMRTENKKTSNHLTTQRKNEKTYNKIER